MKITVYELLGLIKDGKAPKKIFYEGETYVLINNEMYNWYQNNRENDSSSFLDDVFRLKDFLNDEVEIIEEDKKLEKLEIEENCMNRSGRYIKKEDNKFITLSVADYKLATKINELIGEINELKNK